MAKVAQLLKDSNVIERKNESDTLKLWENYQEQALLWRAIALLQIPVTAIALLLGIFLWYTQTTIINVPSKPLPGLYASNEIPDSEYVDVATSFVNLIATYQYPTARAQFQEARKSLIEPMLTKFDADMFGPELRTIERTSRTQVFFVDPTKTIVTRENGEIVVAVSGERLKTLAGKQLEPVSTTFLVTMNIIPRNALNPYGIVISNVAVGSK